MKDSQEWLDSFKGEAIWPALPLPPVERYEDDLALRFSKLQTFLHEHLPVVDKQQRSRAAAQGGANAEDGKGEAISCHASPPRHFRARCRFALERGDDGKLHYYLWNCAEGCATVLADDYPAAAVGIYFLMPRLLAYLNSEAGAVLRQDLRAAHFLTVKDGSSSVVTLIYATPLSPPSWAAAAQAVVGALGAGVSVQGRSKGVRLLQGLPFVLERLSVEGAEEEAGSEEAEAAVEGRQVVCCCCCVSIWTFGTAKQVN